MKLKFNGKFMVFFMTNLQNNKRFEFLLVISGKVRSVL